MIGRGILGSAVCLSMYRLISLEPNEADIQANTHYKTLKTNRGRLVTTNVTRKKKETHLQQTGGRFGQGEGTL